MLKFIHDVKELEKFFIYILPPITDTEVYFTSLSARNKQLTEEEREYYSLGRTEMFERKIIREKNWMKFYRTICKYETNKAAITGREGIPLPSHCLIIYININPCDCVKAYKLFMDNMNENISLLLSGGGSGQDYFKRMDRELMNAIQKSRGVKHYVDIDIDFYDNMHIVAENCMRSILDDLIIRDVKFFLIETKGGYHILMKRDSLKFNFNEVVAAWNRRNYVGVKEIAVNDNAMCPIPGCLQAGFPVAVDYERSNI